MIDLSDCTFNIPVRIESEDRKRNLALVLNYIQNHFKTRVIICEQDTVSRVKGMWQPEWSKFCSLIFLEDVTPLFHKTRCLNIMARASKTPFLISHDSDVLLFPQYYKSARDALKTNQLDFCYPFDQPLHNIPKKYLENLNATFDLTNVKDKVEVPHVSPPPGGCFFINKKKFIEAGLENENMIAYGPEDIERLTRVQRLGYRVARLPGILYHMEHVKVNSSLETHDFSKQNNDEFNKIKNIPQELLRAYVQKWSWKHE